MWPCCCCETCRQTNAELLQVLLRVLQPESALMITVVRKIPFAANRVGSVCLSVQELLLCLTVGSTVEGFIPVAGMALRQSSRSTSAQGLL